MKWLYWLVGIVVAIVVAWNMMFPTYTFRFRTTVTVSTPQGPKTGSSVIEVTWTKLNPLDRALSGGHDWRYKVRGTAPIIDLGRRGTLIAALRYEEPRRGSETGRPGPYQQPIGADVWPESAYGRKPHEFNSRLPPVEMKRGLPQFIWVPPDAEELADSVPLLPHEFGKKFDGSIRLKSVVLAPTDDPVKTSILPEIEWWDRLSSATDARGKIRRKQYREYKESKRKDKSLEDFFPDLSLNKSQIQRP